MRTKIIIVVFIAVILAIPVGSFLLKDKLGLDSSKTSKYDAAVTTQNQADKSAKSPTEVPKTLPIEDLRAQAQNLNGPQNAQAAEVYYGPSLNFKVQLQGRPENNQSAKMFLGIAAGQPDNNPQYLLSFTINVPESGSYNGLSLAGLTIGNIYTIYLKSPGQIATSSAMVVRPTTNELNSGKAMRLLSGDLNEDNVVNDADKTLMQQLLGKKPSSSDWNPLADFNLDKVINSIDYNFVKKNINQVGAGGVYLSKITKAIEDIPFLFSGSPGL